MSAFSEKVKLLIDQSCVTIYQLSKKSGLDRTTIQRTVSGERLPSRAFVEQLADYLRISPSERNELFDLHTINKLGEKVYYGRKCIKDMIERLATIHAEAKPIDQQKNTSSSIKISDLYNHPSDTTKNVDNNMWNRPTHHDASVYEGQYLVNNMIRSILEEEVATQSNPEINVYVPISHTFLLDLLYQLYLSEQGNIKIKTITRFNKSSAYQDSNNNLDILSHVIPFAFSAGNGYELYYYYDNYDISGDIAVIMPYYIITSKYLLTLSTDFNTAILYHNPGIYNIYKKRFHMAVSKSNPLNVTLQSCDGVLLSYIDSYNSFGNISHIIEPQPCFAFYYTSEMINEHLRPDVDNRAVVLDLLFDLYKRYQQHSSRAISIFSKEGLYFFVNTGILSDLPTEYAIPFTIEERQHLLTQLKADIESDSYRVYCSDSMNFTLPLCSIQNYGTKGVSFLTTNNNGIMLFTYINEKSISEAFNDFVNYLPESSLVCTKEETIKIIEGAIVQCNNMLITV